MRSLGCSLLSYLHHYVTYIQHADSLTLEFPKQVLCCWPQEDTVYSSIFYKAPIYENSDLKAPTQESSFTQGTDRIPCSAVPFAPYNPLRSAGFHLPVLDLWTMVSLKSAW